MIFTAPERSIFEAAVALHTRHELCAEGEILAEEVCVKRKSVTFATFAELTKQNPQWGVMLFELKALVRAMRRLHRERLLHRGAVEVSQALKDHDQEKVRATLAALQNVEVVE